MAHTGGASDAGEARQCIRLFPDCRKHISRLPSEYAARLFYDTTAFGKPAIELAIKTLGSSQLLFGTYDPFIDADTTHVERLDLPKDDREAVLGRSASRVPKIDQAHNA